MPRVSAKGQVDIVKRLISFGFDFDRLRLAIMKYKPEIELYPRVQVWQSHSSTNHSDEVSQSRLRSQDHSHVAGGKHQVTKAGKLNIVTIQVQVRVSPSQESKSSSSLRPSQLSKSKSKSRVQV